jgi:hypothetical protein
MLVLGTIDSRATLVLDREFATVLRAHAASHPLNAPLADRIDALLDQGVSRMAAAIEPSSLSDYDCVVRDGRYVFVTDDPELDLLVLVPELADESFFVTVAQLELPALEPAPLEPAATS